MIDILINSMMTFEVLKTQESASLFEIFGLILILIDDTLYNLLNSNYT